MVAICFALERFVSHKREHSISLNNHGVDIVWIMSLDMIMLIYVISLRIISGFGEMGVDDPQRNKLILNTFFVAHYSCIVYYMFKGKKILGHIPAEQTQIL